MPRVVHFEISAEHPEQVVQFYAQVFGWEIQKWEGPVEYWLVKTGSEDEPGIDGGIARRGGEAGWVNTIEVANLDAYAAKITECGGEVVVPKTSIPGVGYQIYCKDPGGSLFGVHQQDPSAS